MPEIVPGGDFGANIDRLFTERSMVMQAWGAYGVLWQLNGSPVKLKLVQSTRGLGATVYARPGQRTATLVINIAP
jgi:hypothetical protein